MTYNQIKIFTIEDGLIRFSTLENEEENSEDDEPLKWYRMNYSYASSGWHRADHEIEEYNEKLWDKPITKLTKKYNWTNKYQTFYSWFRELDHDIAELFQESIDVAIAYSGKEYYRKIETRIELYDHYVADCHWRFIRVRDFWLTCKALKRHLVLDVIKIIVLLQDKNWCY